MPRTIICLAGLTKLALCVRLSITLFVFWVAGWIWSVLCVSTAGKEQAKQDKRAPFFGSERRFWTQTRPIGRPPGPGGFESKLSVCQSMGVGRVQGDNGLQLAGRTGCKRSSVMRDTLPEQQISIICDRQRSPRYIASLTTSNDLEMSFLSTLRRRRLRDKFVRLSILSHRNLRKIVALVPCGTHSKQLHVAHKRLVEKLVAEKRNFRRVKTGLWSVLPHRHCEIFLVRDSKVVMCGKKQLKRRLVLAVPFQCINPGVVCFQGDKSWMNPAQVFSASPFSSFSHSDNNRKCVVSVQMTTPAFPCLVQQVRRNHAEETCQSFELICTCQRSEQNHGTEQTESLQFH